MHLCITSSQTKTWEHKEEYSWSIALYIEIRIDKNKEATVCKHPSYTYVENIRWLVEVIKSISGDEFTHILEVSKVLNSFDPKWREDFEIVIRKNYVSISIYL